MPIIMLVIGMMTMIVCQSVFNYYFDFIERVLWFVLFLKEHHHAQPVEMPIPGSIPSQDFISVADPPVPSVSPSPSISTRDDLSIVAETCPSLTIRQIRRLITLYSVDSSQDGGGDSAVGGGGSTILEGLGEKLDQWKLSLNELVSGSGAAAGTADGEPLGTDFLLPKDQAIKNSDELYKQHQQHLEVDYSKITKASGGEFGYLCKEELPKLDGMPINVLKLLMFRHGQAVESPGHDRPSA